MTTQKNLQKTPFASSPAASNGTGTPSTESYCSQTARKYVADIAGAYWLLDEIALIQPYNKRLAAEGFQLYFINNVIHLPSEY